MVVAANASSGPSAKAPPAQAASGKRELVIVRDFAAPPALVFAMWTEPAHLVRWMGPRGFTATDVAQGRNPGDPWRACLRPDDGGPGLWQGGVLREIVPPERLAFTFAWDGADGRPGRETLVTVTFAGRADGGTRMTFRQGAFDTEANRDGHGRGWGSSFDRLAEQLAEQLAERLADAGDRGAPR